MKVLKRVAKPIPIPQSNARSSLYDRKLSVAYGNVESNNTDGTTNILLKTGILAENLFIPSTTWPLKDPVVGGIKYPPIGAEVIIYYPEGDLNSGRVYPAPLDSKDQGVIDALLDQGDKTILPGGWIYTYDQEKGIAEFTNGTFDFKLDPDAKTFSLTDFEGNTFKNNGALWEINGNSEFAVKFDSLNTAINNLVSSINSSVTGLIPAHTHIITSPGNPSGPGVGIAPTVVGDISASKVTNVKVS